MIAWRIARRYLTSKKSHSAVGVISAVAVAGVAVATAAIVIVLSVFNGFTDLAAMRLSEVDPDLKIEPATGKTFANADSLAQAIMAINGVENAVPVIQERGLLINAGSQTPVIFKGVPQSYTSTVSLDSAIIDGAYEQESYGYAGLLSSVGVALGANARPGTLTKLYVPRRQGRINIANPATAFREQEFIVTGVFQIDQAEYDKEFIFVPIDCARSLLDYTTEATAIEVAAAPGHDAADLMHEIKHTLGDNANVLTRMMQEESSFRMIQIEKWVTFLMLAFILVIASFNIVSTLSLMVIEKKGNMATLRAIGATRGIVRRVFMWQGCMITFLGGAIGIALGAMLSLAQQIGGFIKLAGDASQLSITSYPVKVQATDLLIVAAVVAAIALLTSLATVFFSQDKNFKIR